MNNAFNKIIKSQIKLTILTVIAVTLVATSTSYALYQKAHENTSNQVIDIGTLNTSITSGGVMVLKDIYPMKQSDLNENYPTYSFIIDNKNVEDAYNASYQVFLKNETESLISSNSETYGSYTPLSVSEYQHIMISIDGKTGVTLASIYDSENDRFVIKSGTLNPGDSETHTLQIWLGETAPNGIQGKVLSLKIALSSVAIQDSSDTQVVHCIDPNTNEKITCSTITTGTKFAIKSERFYVISNNAGTIRALAEYNLNVGSNKNSEVTEGLQHKSVKGLIQSGTIYGNVAFYSGSTKSPDAYTQYNRDGTTAEIAADTGYTNYAYSDIKTYVDAYKDTLNGASLGNGIVTSADLITFPELIALGCTYNSSKYSGTCNNDGVPNWVYSSSYWSGSAYNYDGVWYVHFDGDFGGNSCHNDGGLGVRPVITLNESSFKLNS